MNKKIIFLIFIILISSIVCAEQQYKTINGFLAKDNTLRLNELPMTKNIDLLFPDGVSSIDYFIVEVIGDYTANTLITVSVGSNNCGVGTTSPNIDVKNYKMMFDCTNRIQNKLSKNRVNVDININTDTIVPNIVGKYETTYLNQPVIEIEVFGTEYKYPQEAKVWLQLINTTDNSYISQANCFTDIYTPDNSEYLERVKMTYFHDGIYYYDLLTPTSQGVYPVIAKCFFSATETRQYVDAVTLINFSIEGNTYTETLVSDGTDHLVTEEKLGGQSTLDFIYEFKGNGTKCWETLDETEITGLTVGWEGNWNSVVNDNARFYIYNFTSASWYEFSNTVSVDGGEQIVTNSLELINFTKAGFVNSSNDLRIRITDTGSIGDNSKTSFDTDLFYVSCDALTTGEWQYVRGTNEMHITSDFEFYVEGEHGFGNTRNVPAGDIYIDDVRYVQINYTIGSGSFEDKEISAHFHSPFQFNCDTVTNIRETTSNGTLIRNINVSDDDESFNPRWHNEFNHCDIYFDQNISKGENYYFSVDYVNTPILGVEAIFAGEKNLYDFISGMCMYYQIANGYDNYTIPIENHIIGNDSFYHTCEHYFDSFYYYNESYQQIESFLPFIENVHDLEIIVNDFVTFNGLNQQMRSLSTSLFEEITMINAYSETAQNSPLSPTQAVFWSGVSQSNINYDLLLTSVSQTNSTNIANSVWSNTEITISDNILNQLIIGVWDYNGGRYIHGEII